MLAFQCIASGEQATYQSTKIKVDKGLDDFVKVELGLAMSTPKVARPLLLVIGHQGQSWPTCYIVPDFGKFSWSDDSWVYTAIHREIWSDGNHRNCDSRHWKYAQAPLNIKYATFNLTFGTFYEYIWQFHLHSS